MSVRKATRQRQQPLGARTREAVDRLVVVADGAELVPVAEPEIEQRLLEEVDVLVLVDRERAPALVHRGPRPVVPFEQAHRPLEQVLEVEQPLRRLPPLVLAEDPAHEVARQRRLVLAEPLVVGLGRETPIPRPLDLGREVARGPEAEGPRQRVADPAEKQRLGGKDPARVSLEVAEQGQRRRVEGGRPHTVDAQRAEPRAQLARGLAGERDGHELLRRGTLRSRPARRCAA